MGNTIEKSERMICFENYTSDRLQVTVTGDGFCFAAESDWAGCTETGFGEACDFTLTKQEASVLCAWLQQKFID